MTEFERGFQAGKQAALREQIEKLSSPSAKWMPEWRPIVYRVLACIAGDYFGGQVPIRGEHRDFGVEHLTVNDFIWTPESYRPCLSQPTTD